MPRTVYCQLLKREAEGLDAPHNMLFFALPRRRIPGRKPPQFAFAK